METRHILGNAHISAEELDAVHRTPENGETRWCILITASGGKEVIIYVYKIKK